MPGIYGRGIQIRRRYGLGKILRYSEPEQTLESRGHKFVRYADDMLIFCKSKRAAERTLESITPYIENKLFLKVNREKTSVSYVRGVKFLGYLCLRALDVFDIYITSAISLCNWGNTITADYDFLKGVDSNV